MRKSLGVLFSIAFILSVLWYYFSPGYEPAITALASLSALISNVFIRQKKTRDDGQNQTVGDNSAAIQAGRDVDISVRTNRDEDGEC